MANADLFDKAGAQIAPKDWDGFLAMCEKLAASGVIPISWPGGDVGNGGQLFNCMIANNAPVDDMCAQIEQGKLKCTDDWFLKMLGQYKDLVPYLQPNATGTAVEPAQNLFSQGKAAMLATGSYHIAAVRGLGATFPIELVFPNTSDGSGKFEGAYNATFILGVNSASKNQAASAAWIDFLSEPENAGYYANETAQHVAVSRRGVHQPGSEAPEPLAGQKDSPGRPLPVREPGRPQRGGGQRHGCHLGHQPRAGRRSRPEDC